MFEFEIKINDEQNSVGVLSERQLNPTGLNVVHPAKHIAPDDIQEFNPLNGSLFVSKQQRDELLEFIRNNLVIKTFIIKKIRSMGGGFRIRFDINIEYLDSSTEHKYWSSCKQSQTYQLKPMEWVTVVLDFAGLERLIEQLNHPKIVAVLHSTFPLESEHRKNNPSGLVIHVELLCPGFVESLAITSTGEEVKHPLYSTVKLHGKNVKLKRGCWDLTEKHDIFKYYNGVAKNKNAPGEIISSFQTLPFPTKKVPDLKAKEAMVEADFKTLNDDESISKLNEHLNKLKIAPDELDGIIKEFSELSLSFDGFDEEKNALMLSHIERAKNLIQRINITGIRALSDWHFPPVSRDDLINIVQNIKEALDQGVDSIVVQHNDKEFLIESKKKDRKNLLKSFTSLLSELNDPEVEQEAIYNKATGQLRLFLRLGDNILCKSPDLIASQTIVQQRKKALESAQRTLLQIQGLQKDIQTVLELNESALAIQNREFNEPVSRLLELSGKITHTNNINEAIVSNIQNYLEEHESLFSVTKLIDEQVEVYIESLKNSFVFKLADLLKCLIQYHESSEHLLLMSELRLECIEFFFTNINGMFEMNDDIFDIPEGNYDDFCLAILNARLLITALNNFLVENRSRTDEDVELISNLSNSIQDFYDIRRTHPYLIKPLIDSNSQYGSDTYFIEAILKSLSYRLEAENAYSIAIKNKDYKGKSNTLNEFLNKLEQPYISLDNIRSSLDRIKERSCIQGDETSSQNDKGVIVEKTTLAIGKKCSIWAVTDAACATSSSGPSTSNDNPLNVHLGLRASQ